MRYQLQGYFYGNANSHREPAELRCDDNGILSVVGASPVTIRVPAVPVFEVVISSRLGNTPRFIRFPGGEAFETDDNDTVDRLLREFQGPQTGFVHLLETHKGIIAATVLTMVVLVGSFVRWGIPALSHQIAVAVPDRYAYRLGDEILDVMDANWFAPTTLTPGHQQEIEALFENALDDEEREWFTLTFRDGGPLHANAFALPNGTIVLTDQLVMLADNPYELLAVIIHELGHLKYRHGIQQIVNQAGLAVVITLVTGDVSTSSSLAISLPAVLVQAGYSQEMEWAADGFALDYLMAQDINPLHFATMMEKLAWENSTGRYTRRRAVEETTRGGTVSNEQHGDAADAEIQIGDVGSLDTGESVADREVRAEDQAQAGDEGFESLFRRYFSTHPEDEARIRRFIAASRERESWAH